MRTAIPAILLVLCSCSSASKVEAVREGVLAPSLSMAEDLPPADLLAPEPVSDTIQVTDAQGRSMLLMRAVRDENGEMVASDVISPVVVAARFRNVAERQGKVTLRFDVKVPSGMVESGWHPGGSDVRGSRASVHRHRGHGPGRCELAGCVERWCFRRGDRRAAGTGGPAGSRRD